MTESVLMRPAAAGRMSTILRHRSPILSHLRKSLVQLSIGLDT
jgi:hypothetical protein